MPLEQSHLFGAFLRFVKHACFIFAFVNTWHSLAPCVRVFRLQEYALRQDGIERTDWLLAVKLLVSWDNQLGDVLGAVIQNLVHACRLEGILLKWK